MDSRGPVATDTRGKTMNEKVKSFAKLEQADRPLAGGKGGTLAHLFQKGYPVPDGFVIMPDAFIGDELSSDGWQQVKTHLAYSRNGSSATSFAVRSSALSEDSAQASFAGEFETVLDVHTDEMVREAIYTVRRSRLSERVQAYSQAKGMDLSHEIAVVVQRLVRAEISGILFTADPVTGSNLHMSGNFIYGLGDELVSGEAEPFTFTLTRPKAIYDGPPELKRYAKKLFKMGSRLEKEFECPQDIEWCVADGKLHLLQSRPITTLMAYDPITCIWNSSHAGDYLWFRHEVFPDVLTPSSWSVWRTFQQFNVLGMAGIGNIGGRMYMNYTMVETLMLTFGRSEKDVKDQIALTAGTIPEKITIPKMPVTKWAVIKSMLPIMFKLLPEQYRLMRKHQQIIDATPEKCRQLRQEIQETENGAKLIRLWREEIFPFFSDFLQLQDKANEDYFFPYMAVKRQLTTLVGEAESNAILATLSAGSGQLASMGALAGLAKVSAGEMSRQEYMQIAGHRPVQENELAVPRPYEDAQWLDRQLAEYEKDPIDVAAMSARRKAEFDALWQDVVEAYPREAKKLQKKIDRATAGMEKREKVRSELTRTFGVIRDWFLRAAELTGLGEGVFYLSFEEVIDVLSGDDAVTDTIPARQETYDKLRALPPYPMFISGRFDPFQWAADPQRRADAFDSHVPYQVSQSDTIKGYPGSAGRVEGVVRYLTSPDNGHQLQEGEILLASTTNVGWTPLFPHAAAVITDIGAPLSHAAIIARELGIPAVVGTGDATMRLRSGDRVRVDGSQGIVELLN
jgi:pyruvate,water dikinase